MDLRSFKCPECDYFDELGGLRRHCVRSHDITAESLYRVLFLNGKEPACECGCGQVITKFWGIEKGFSKFVRGHHSRVHNNWGHNKAAQEKSQDVRREMHKRGEITIWNKGETKETDERLRAYGAKGSETIKSQPELLQQRSDDMKRYWETGVIVPLSGSSHSMWKGGTSALQNLVRSHLFRAWSRPIMERDRFTCQHCGKQGTLCVHHDQERFAEILQKAMQHLQASDATQLTFDQKQELSLWVIDYHLDNKISGVVLCEKCHEEVHRVH